MRGPGRGCVPAFSLLGWLGHTADMSDVQLNAIRISYDRVADAYAEAIFHELEKKPFDRDALKRFAAAAKGRGTVCDMGCGPGHIARFLHDLGVDATGLDLSPGMLEQARRLNPDIVFSEGDMTALKLDDGSLRAITAFYAIVNLAAELRRKAFCEMARVLAPEGLMLLAFHVGSDELDVKELWGRPIDMSFYLLDPAKIEAELISEGFAIEELTVRDPYPPDVEHQTRRAYVWARKTGD
jgi:ubiquinone/menaquinone biosynthesis C-methylase UbiE